MGNKVWSYQTSATQASPEPDDLSSVLGKKGCAPHLTPTQLPEPARCYLAPGINVTDCYNKQDT